MLLVITVDMLVMTLDILVMTIVNLKSHVWLRASFWSGPKLSTKYFRLCLCEYLDYRGEQRKAHDLLFHVCSYDQVFQFDGTHSNSLKVFQFQVISSSSCPFYFSVFMNKFNRVESNFLLVIYIIGIYITRFLTRWRVFFLNYKENKKYTFNPLKQNFII
jgi:hypothetical protein